MKRQRKKGKRGKVKRGSGVEDRKEVKEEKEQKWKSVFKEIDEERRGREEE